MTTNDGVNPNQESAAPQPAPLKWWEEVEQARAAAHKKHGANSIEAIDPHSDRWNTILGEEAGEVSEVLVHMFAGSILNKALGRVSAAQTYDKDIENLERELIDVLSVASAWLDRLREWKRKQKIAGLRQQIKDLTPPTESYNLDDLLDDDGF